jgi:hypothetical protein
VTVRNRRRFDSIDRRPGADHAEHLPNLPRPTQRLWTR